MEDILIREAQPEDALQLMNDTKIDIDKIKVGDTISANYRGEWKKANIALDATYIRVVGK